MTMTEELTADVEPQSEHGKARRATPMTVNFTRVIDIRQHASGNVQDRGHTTDLRPRTPEGKLLTPKQIRARARRRIKRAKGKPGRKIVPVTEQEFDALYKPIDDWDLQELARGRPRDSRGGFGGKPPGWITREVHEKAMEQFHAAIKSEMGSLTPTALDTVKYILENEDVDHRGKPIVPASAKNQAAMFLLEHVVGKPKQQIQQDISVKLQGILGSVMVNPNDALAPPSQGGRLGEGESDIPGYSLAHLPGVTLPLGSGDIVDGEGYWHDQDADLDEVSES